MTINKPELTHKHLVFFSSLFLILVFPILVDLANGLIYYVLRKEFSVGVLYRGLMNIVLLPFIFYIRDRTLQFYVFTITFFWLICNMVWSQVAFESSLIEELRTYSRFILQFVMLGYLIYLVERFKINLDFLMKLTVWYGIIAGLAILFSFFTGIGNSVYRSEDLSYGVVSFFKAQNDIGLSILLTLPFAMYFFLKEFKFKWFLAVVIIVYSLFAISTRAAVLGSIGVLVLYVVMMPLYSRKQIAVPFAVKIAFVFLFMATLAIGIPLYVQFLTQNPFMLTKYATMIEDQGVRVDLVTVAIEAIQKRNLVLNLFGEGDYGFHVEMAKVLYGSGLIPEGGRRAEQDIFDFIGSYGYILGLIILIFPVFCILKIGTRFLISRKLLDFTFLCSIALFTFHSFTAGHALGSPTVSTTVVLSYLYILQYKKFNTKVT